MMAMMGNGIGSYGSVIGGREKEIREEVLGSVFCAFEIGFFFFFLLQKLLGTIGDIERTA